MEFPYLKVQPGLSGPMVPIELWSPRDANWIDMEAYVDSGATYSIFGIEIVEILGLNLTHGRRVSVVIGDGKNLPVYLFKIPVRFAEIIFPALIGFSEKLGVGFNLLGRQTFFTKFRFCFSDRQRIVQVTHLE